jgi:protein-arginine kinase activator protein McsA
MIQMISFHIPEEPELLATLGEVALRHEQMNHILKMTIKTLTNLTPEEAIAATKYESSSQLRDRIKKLARKQLGEGAPLL